MPVSRREHPPIRAITDTEDDFSTVAHLCRVMDLALLHMNVDKDPKPGDLEALSHLSGLIEPAARRLLSDFEALNAAGIFASLWGRGQEATP